MQRHSEQPLSCIDTPAATCYHRISKLPNFGTIEGSQLGKIERVLV